MAQVESANHEGSAFSRVLPTSRHEATEYLDALVVAWVAGLVLYTLLEATLLVDSSGFMRAAAWLDQPLMAWLVVGFGYVCILAVGSQLRSSSHSRSEATRRTLLSTLALASFSLDVFLMRWPWLVGSADATSRLSVWGATLSTTWRGMPVVAFAEVLGVGAIVTQGLLGLREVAVQRGWAPMLGHARHAGLVIGLATQLLASAIIVALATGRR